MGLTRNPVPFLRRHCLVGESARPKPRLDPAALLVHTDPLSTPPAPAQAVLAAAEGSPPPDRGTARGWPDELTPGTDP